MFFSYLLLQSSIKDITLQSSAVWPEKEQRSTTNFDQIDKEDRLVPK